MVAEWDHIVVDQRFGEPPADILLINDGVSSIKMIQYERFHNFCYNDMIRDYVFKFTPSIEFLTTINYLNRNNKFNRAIIGQMLTQSR